MANDWLHADDKAHAPTHQHIIRTNRRILNQPNGQTNGFGCRATASTACFHGVGRDFVGGFADFLLPKILSIFDKII